MHPFLKHNILQQVSVIAGVLVHLINREEMRFSLIIIRRRKKQLFIEHRQEQFLSVDELKERIPSNVPVLLHVDGWGVLIKKSSLGADGQTEALYDSSEFEIRHFFTDESSKGHLSIIRQEVIEEVVERVKTLGAGLLGIDVGPFAGIQLLLALNKEGNFLLGNRTVVIKDKNIVEIKGSNDSIDSVLAIGDDNISSQLFPAYAMVALFFANSFDGLKRSSQPLKEFLYKKLTFYVTAFSLGALFIGLILNYLLFTHYQERLISVTSEFEVNQTLYKKLEQKEKELEQKEKLIESSGLSGRTFFAYYADRLALSMPKRILLEKLEFQPLEKRLQKGREAIFTEKMIEVTGLTPQSLLINDWMHSIKKEPWVKSVDMVYYNQEEKLTNALFKLEIRF
jgi:Tfp pilus assembly protein PilN